MEKTKIKFIDMLIVLLVLTLVIGFVSMFFRLKGALMEQKQRKLVLYEGPLSLEDATEEDLLTTSENKRDITLKHCVDTTIAINGMDCYVYDTNVNHTRQWVSNYLPPISRTPITYFDFAGRAEIVITIPNTELNEVSISPKSYDIKPYINKKQSTITFSITEPDTYTVMLNDSPERAIHIFANPIEEDVPDFNDENVVYIGSGEWDIDAINVRSNQTIYLSGGAVLHGVINSSFVENITIMGRGIIDGSKLEGWKGQVARIPLNFENCSNVTVKDVIVLNANAWVFQGYNSNQMYVDGLKIISPRPNGDGISLQSCENVVVKNCFVRTWDDSLVIKNYDKNSQNISFEKMQLWTDFAQSMEIGYETNKGQKNNAFIKNITFSDICILQNFHKPVISVHNGDDAIISDIEFNHIIVENAMMGSGDGNEMPYLIDINIMQNSNWSSTKERGSIEDITITNINVLDGVFPPSRIKGYDPEHTVKNVAISNLQILGEEITDFESGKFEIEEATTSDLSIQ